MISQRYITPNTPTGATLAKRGATFKVWAPHARAVFLNGCFGGQDAWFGERSDSWLMQKAEDGYWTGYERKARDGDQYKFFVVGEGSRGFKRDPYARELTSHLCIPARKCVIRNEAAYAWHDEGFAGHAYSDLVIYELHVGSFARTPSGECGTFLDVITNIPYLNSIGINALQMMPVTQTLKIPNMGYDVT
jgi:1,4-alpha-glucan branching enzyme